MGGRRLIPKSFSSTKRSLPADSLEVKVRALLAERRQRIGYEKELEAAASACRCLLSSLNEVEWQAWLAKRRLTGVHRRCNKARHNHRA